MTKADTTNSSVVPSPLSGAGDTPKLTRRRGKQVWVGRALCFAACVLAVNALIGERGLSETFRARREFRQAVAELSRLQYENATLTNTIERLRHDARTIEGVARAELGLIRPGEILVSVKTPNVSVKTPNVSPVAKPVSPR